MLLSKLIWLAEKTDAFKEELVLPRVVVYRFLFSWAWFVPLKCFVNFSCLRPTALAFLSRCSLGGTLHQVQEQAAMEALAPASSLTAEGSPSIGNQSWCGKYWGKKARYYLHPVLFPDCNTVDARLKVLFDFWRKRQIVYGMPLTRLLGQPEMHPPTMVPLPLAPIQSRRLQVHNQC